MKVALVQCPANNPDSPPYAYAILNSCLAEAGHEPVVFDLNIALYGHARSRGEATPWRSGHNQESPIEFWIHDEYVQEVLEPYQDFIDDYIERVLATDAPVIGFSAHTSSYLASLQIARKVKEADPSRTIVFGGPYCFLNYEGDYLLDRHDFIDVVCFLEAERSFPELLRRMDAGEEYFSMPGYGFRLPDGSVQNNTIDTIHRKEPKGTLIEDLDTIPFADWTCFDLSDYEEKYLPIMTSRGCIRRCSFCSEAPIWGKFRHRSAANIAEEMMLQASRHPEVSTFWFMDSLVNGDIPMLEELCDILIANQTAGPDGKARGNGKFGWTGQFLVRKQMTDEIWKKVSLAGGQWFACGLENGSDRILRMMRKGYDRELAKEVIGRAQSVDPDLVSVAMFVVGHPGETEEDFQDTLDMISYLKDVGVSSSVSKCDVRRGSHLWFNKDAYDIVYPPGEEHPWAWYSKDGSNTPEHRERLLQRAMELQASALHTLKPGEKGLVEGGISVHFHGELVVDPEPMPEPSVIERVAQVVLRRKPSKTG